jgi:hypothetical protein
MPIKFIAIKFARHLGLMKEANELCWLVLPAHKRFIRKFV